ncbi:MAG: hypothetical protein LBN32_03400 [Helicobacteraceae bacterium]|jgi:hypothetical protein|nr:hypothetical protein [Helicobacteraceae bacterium]
MNELPPLDFSVKVKERFLDKEAQELTQTLIRIEALSQNGVAQKSAEIERAQLMIGVLQQRIERLRRLSKSG